VNYDRVDEDGVQRLIESIRRGDIPRPRLGEPPVDFKATSRRLAGLGDS
jgi:hypothetical protein